VVSSVSVSSGFAISTLFLDGMISHSSWPGLSRPSRLGGQVLRP
jgi:hypothetical protein